MIIRTEIKPSRRTVHLLGRFDAHETAQFRTSVHPLVTVDDAFLYLDLSQVAFVDSSALTELVRLRKMSRSYGGEVVLVELSDAVRVILEITDLAELFTIESTPEAS